MRKNNSTPKPLYGTFIDVKDSTTSNKYKHNWKDSDFDRGMKIEAFDWIKNNKNFEIERIEYKYYNFNEFAEEVYVAVEENKEKFDYDDLAVIMFNCKKDNKNFVLVPKFKWSRNNKTRYSIPEVELYNLKPEEIGLIRTAR